MEDGTGTISYTDSQFMFTENSYNNSPPGDSVANKDVDMTDDVPWPKDFFQGYSRTRRENYPSK